MLLDSLPTMALISIEVPGKARKRNALTDSAIKALKAEGKGTRWRKY